MAQAAVQNTTATPVLYVALELSKDTWKLGITLDRVSKAKIRDVRARDLDGLLAEIEAAKKHFNLPENTLVKSCYEAGRDGFWIHRFLLAHGIENVIIDPASIEVDRRSRKVKTDRVDAQKMAQLLARHGDGERVLRVVRVPPLESVDERILPRDLKALKKRREQAANKIQASLFEHGVDLNPRLGSFKDKDFLTALKAARQWDGKRLPPECLRSVKRSWQLYSLLTKQIKELEQRQRQVLREARAEPEKATSAARKAAILSQLRGVGDIGSYVLTTEFFGWRDFDNRSQVGALAGLTGTPFQSGNMGRDQGISKSGNPRVRTLMVELGWLWLRWQPDSRTTKWYHEHVGKGGSRAKRKAIVAVARKLLVEFWHFVEHGVVPTGAVLKTTNAEGSPA
ncbi:Transposase IS116/IS110/IS902 family protein [Planctomycetes bacterium Poly30]|uniref:Transposase IS116/IS110/IS902 family protein n=1 Tax=Saltatorellus ferox TaxID=2528018 RepID=A0A518EZT8_9BACT|nr:Transposase IS116/IS110/IS902 family protein [Planctomycetes bacterium Poly30]